MEVILWHQLMAQEILAQLPHLVQLVVILLVMADLLQLFVDLSPLV